jgi:hypothetical protein
VKFDSFEYFQPLPVVNVRPGKYQSVVKSTKIDYLIYFKMFPEKPLISRKLKKSREKLRFFDVILIRTEPSNRPGRAGPGRASKTQCSEV